MGIATSKPQSRIIYVSKNGNDDNNSGAIDSPYRTIQGAIDDLVTIYGHDEHKEVRLLDDLDSPNDYDSIGSTFIRTKNLTIKGVGNSRVRCVSDDITFVITNILDWDALQADGGLAYSVATAAYTPGHATIADRDVDPDLGVDSEDWNIRFENLYIESYSDNGVNGEGTCVAAVFSEAPGNNTSVYNIAFDGCKFNIAKSDFSPAQTCLFLRSCRNVLFVGNNEVAAAVDDTKSLFVFENTLETIFSSHVTAARPLFYFDTNDDVIPTTSLRRMLEYGALAPDFDMLQVDWDGATPELRNCDIKETLRIETNVDLYNCSVNNLEGNGTATMNGGGYYGTNNANVAHTPLSTT